MSLLFSQLLLLLWVHPIHITKSQVDCNQQAQSVQVSMHIFLDDLELAIQKETGYEGKMNLGTEKEIMQGDSLLMAYLEHHFQIKVNGQNLAFHYVGKENSQDLLAVWVYFEFPFEGVVSELQLHNSMLLALYDDQQNITSVIGPQREKEFFLLKGEDTEKILHF